MSHLIQATLSAMSLAMVAKAGMSMARAAEERENEEEEQAEDANLAAVLLRMEHALRMMDDLRNALYKPESGSEPLKTEEIPRDGNPENEG